MQITMPEMEKEQQYRSCRRWIYRSFIVRFYISVCNTFWVNFCKWYEVFFFLMDVKLCPFFIKLPVYLCQKSINQTSLFLNSVFCPIDLCVCPFAKAYCLDYYILFWNQVMWILQQNFQSYFSYSRSFVFPFKF